MGILNNPLSRWARKKINPNIYPNNEWYRQHLERNFDAINFGDYFASVYFDYSKSDLMGWNFALPNQNIHWDFEVLKQVFSILKKGGTAIFPISDYELARANKKISKRPYYLCIEPYYLGRNDLERNIIRVLKRLPILLLTPKYLCPCSCKHYEKYMSCSVTADNIPFSLIEQIRSFCIEREIKAVFVTFNIEDKPDINMVSKTIADYVIDLPKDVLLPNSYMLNDAGKQKLMDDYIKVIVNK